MTSRVLRSLVVALAMAVVTPALITSASAQQLVPPIEKHRYWGVYANGQGSERVCFILSQPYDSEPKNVNRGGIYFYLTSRPSEGVRNEPLIAMGYPLDVSRPASVSIDGERTFQLQTEGQTAWVANPAEEAIIIEAMRAGRQMVVRGTSTRGTNTVDTYSLLGVTAALNALQRQCP